MITRQIVWRTCGTVLTCGSGVSSTMTGELLPVVGYRTQPMTSETLSRSPYRRSGMVRPTSAPVESSQGGAAGPEQPRRYVLDVGVDLSILPIEWWQEAASASDYRDSSSGLTLTTGSMSSRRPLESATAANPAVAIRPVVWVAVE